MCACLQYYIFFVTYKLVQTVRVFGTFKPFKLSIMKQSSLFVSYEENEVLWIQPRGHIHNTSFSS